MTLRNLPIRRKLVVIILITCGAVSLLTSASLFIEDMLNRRQSAVRELSTLSRILAANSTAALTFDNAQDAAEILSAVRAEPHITAAALYDRAGRLFSRYPDNLEVTELPAVPQAAGYRFADAHLTGFEPVLLDGRLIGTLYLQSDLGALTQRIHSFAIMVLALAGVSFLVAYVLSTMLQKQISEPIIALAETARAVSEQQDYAVRARKFSEDELGLLTDAFNHMLTQIQKLNQTLEQRVTERTAQLQAANKELEAFSYSVSHDLRAPLRHIDGFAQLLQKRIGSTLDAVGQRHLATISSSAKNLGILIDELLLFCRMGRTEMRQTRTDMRAMVEEVVRSLQPDLQGRTIEWVVGELPVVQADPAMLRQVWVNLISNAVKYSRTRAVARIEISHRVEAGDGHVFSVRDNGAGFDMTYADKLFGVFQRLHAAHEFEGTGIGLANVQRIVLRHGGRTWAEGVVGEGATFYFSLPVAGTFPEAETAPPDSTHHPL